MMDQTRATIQGFHDALNSRDIDALAEWVHEDCVFETTAPPDGVRHVGREAVLLACREFFAGSTDMSEVSTSCGWLMARSSRRLPT